MRGRKVTCIWLRPLLLNLPLDTLSIVHIPRNNRLILPVVADDNLAHSHSDSAEQSANLFKNSAHF